MESVSINPWAVLVAALSTFVIGGVWYSPILFARQWMAAASLTAQEVESGNMAKILGGALVLELVMAANLAAFLSGPPNVVWGMIAGALVGLGWVSLALGVIYLFEHRPFKLWLINSGYQLVSFVVMGAILGAWK